MIHSVIEAMLKGEDWEKVLDDYTKKFNSYLEPEREQLGDLPTDLRDIAVRYANTYKTDTLKYLFVERSFDVPLFTEAQMDELDRDYGRMGFDLPQINFVGKIDACATNGKATYVVEHKSVSTMPDESVRLLDVQTPLYAYVINDRLDESFKVDAVLWDYIKTKTPVVPKMLASGKGLSQDKRIDTDYNTYYNAILANGLKPSDYTEMLVTLQQKGNTFFKRVPMPLKNTKVVAKLVDDFKATAIEVALNGETNQVMHYSKNRCFNCEYRMLCDAKLYDEDVDYLKASSFKKVKKE
jgi:CRISPR/Cas system-associated exonuclease Cas4 (RecB family)